MSDTVQPANLKFRKVIAGYRSDGPTKSYVVGRAVQGRGWVLAIFEQVRVAGLTVLGREIAATWAETKGDAVAIAKVYEALGDGYLAHEHGYRERLTEAIGQAYDWLADNENRSAAS